MSYHDFQDLDRHPKNEAQRNKLRDDRYEELLIEIPKKIKEDDSYTTRHGDSRLATSALELVALNMTHDQIMPLIKNILTIDTEAFLEAILAIDEAIETTADQLAQDYLENM